MVRFVFKRGSEGLHGNDGAELTIYLMNSIFHFHYLECQRVLPISQ
jgi:hypothetical protein